MIRTTTTLATLLLLSACVSVPSQQVAAVLEVQQPDVAGCQFLGEAKGMSGYGGVAAKRTGRNNARVSAKTKAQQMGATHVVWVAEGDYIATAVAHAYRCG